MESIRNTSRKKRWPRGSCSMTAWLGYASMVTKTSAFWSKYSWIRVCHRLEKILKSISGCTLPAFSTSNPSCTSSASTEASKKSPSSYISSEWAHSIRRDRTHSWHYKCSSDCSITLRMSRTAKTTWKSSISIIKTYMASATIRRSIRPIRASSHKCRSETWGTYSKLPIHLMVQICTCLGIWEAMRAFITCQCRRMLNTWYSIKRWMRAIIMSLMATTWMKDWWTSGKIRWMATVRIECSLRSRIWISKRCWPASTSRLSLPIWTSMRRNSQWGCMGARVARIRTACLPSPCFRSFRTRNSITWVARRVAIMTDAVAVHMAPSSLEDSLGVPRPIRCQTCTMEDRVTADPSSTHSTINRIECHSHIHSHSESSQSSIVSVTASLSHISWLKMGNIYEPSLSMNILSICLRTRNKYKPNLIRSGSLVSSQSN